MHNATLSLFARDCRVRRTSRSTATILLVCCALALFCALPAVTAQDAKPAAMPTAPSAGKALVCIYRVYRFTGSSSHDNLYINGVFLAKLLNSEYACTEVAPGPVVIAGLTKMYYGGVTSRSARRSTTQERRRTSGISLTRRRASLITSSGLPAPWRQAPK